MTSSKMTQVQTRSGEMQPFDGEKMKLRLATFRYPTSKNKIDMNLIDVDLIYKKAYDRMEDGMTTTALSYLLADVCLEVAPPKLETQYTILARRIIVTTNHKLYKKNMVEFVKSSRDKLVFFKSALDFIEENVGALENGMRHYQDTFYSYNILRQNKISRFQFVLLLLIVHGALMREQTQTNDGVLEIEEEDVCMEETKGGEHQNNKTILAIIKEDYEKISQDPMQVEDLYKKWKRQLPCQ